MLMTSHGNEQVAVEAMKAGAADYVVKTPESLARVPHRALSIVREWRFLSERRRMEIALKESERRYRELVENANSIILRWNRDGRVTFLNEYGQRFFGYRPEEILGRHVVGTLVPETDAAGRSLRPLIDEICARPDLYEQNSNENMRRNGERVWVSWTNRIVRDAQGEVTEIFSIGSDITDRMQFEEKLRDQASLLDEVQDAIGVIDTGGQLTLWSRAAERLYGWQAAEVLGRHPVDFLYRQVPAVRQEACRQVLESGEWHGELHQVTKQGADIVVDSRWRLLRRSDGKPKGILFVNTDVTERKQLEARYLRAQRMESVGALVNGIAHDLNNVLTPIVMAVPMLKWDLNAEEFDSTLAMIEASAGRGSALLKQLLSFSRGGGGERVPVHLRHLVGETAKVAKETFPKSIRVRTDMAADLVAVRADPTQIHQVLMNLCVNARDAMPQGGTLTVVAHNVTLDSAQLKAHPDCQPGAYVVLRVSDNGVGIEPGILDRIFEPFFTTKEPGQGTGLGLATVHGIVRSHGGFVEVRSRVGHGTSFEVFLPASPEGTAGHGAAPPSCHRNGRGELVMVVDDEAEIRRVTRQVLENRGYRVVVASDGAEAMQLYSRHEKEIQLVLTDVAMPVMDGLALIGWMRNRNPQVRVLASTGAADFQKPDAKFQALRDLNVKTILIKPYTAEDLLTAVQEQLSATRFLRRSAPASPSGGGVESCLQSN
jgi:hypothetical protein